MSWTPELEAELVRLALRGWTAASIAARFRHDFTSNFTRSSVCAKANRMGVPLGTGVDRASRIKQHPNIRIFKPDQRGRIVELAQAGHSATSIGRELGVSHSTIRRYCFKYDIPIERGGRAGDKKPVRRQKTAHRGDYRAVPETAPLCTDGISFTQLQPHSCRWPIGNWPVIPEGASAGCYRFCGEKKYKGYSYCAPHCRLAYEPA